MSAAPTLTIVIPAYNQAGEIAATLEAIDEAVARSPFAACIVVVDDGSSDATGEAVQRASVSIPVRVIRQENAGRLSARRTGLAAAEGEFVLLVDSRVLIDRDALAFVAASLERDPKATVWNAHVDIEATGNPYGVFWDVLTRIVFARYFAEPRTTSFGLREFDAFPKGTTCFLARREDLVRVFAATRSRYEDDRYANDDTVAIRDLAASSRINISPSFRCTYLPRRSLKGFVRHAFHRGIVFLDGHGRRGTRLFPVVVAFYPASAAWVVLATRSRWVAVMPFVGAAAGGALLALRLRRWSDAPATAAVSVVYAVAHGAGMWRGLLMMLRATGRRG